MGGVSYMCMVDESLWAPGARSEYRAVGSA